MVFFQKVMGGQPSQSSPCDFLKKNQLSTFLLDLVPIITLSHHVATYLAGIIATQLGLVIYYLSVRIIKGIKAIWIIMVQSGFKKLAESQNFQDECDELPSELSNLAGLLARQLAIYILSLKAAALANILCYVGSWIFLDLLHAMSLA